MSMNSALIWGSFVADALSLGAHWEYDPAAITAAHGRVETLIAPGNKSYHAGKQAGEFTHYGDQLLVLLESVAQSGGFVLSDFCTRWQALFADYTGYYDGATKNTLKMFEFGEGPEGSGANSTDLAGCSRMAPVLFQAGNDANAMVEAALTQTRMTHNNSYVLDSARYWALVVHHVSSGMGVVEALHAGAEAGYDSAPIAQWVGAGINSVQTSTVEAIGRFGSSCNVNGAFPGTIHLLAKYPDNLQEALVECVMAGGDSSARGMIVGMVLGAALGMDAVPEQWINGLAHRQAIAKYVDMIEG